MDSGDSGINKPFDRILKSLIDEDPVFFLRVLGLLPAGVDVEIRPLRPETAPPVIMPDYVGMARIGSQDPVICHTEFAAWYYGDAPRDMAHYGGSLGWQYKIPVASAMVLLRPEGAPAKVPEEGDYNIGPTHTIHPYRVVKLWEIDPTPVIERANPRFLCWALLMNTTEEQVRKIAAIVSNQEDEEAVARFLMLGSIRYDRTTLIEMLGGGNMSIGRAFREASSLVRYERELGLAEGTEKGMAQGRADEARRALRIGLRAKFPNLIDLAEIDGISNIESLESLLDSVFRSNDSDEIRSQILSAASKPN